MTNTMCVPALPSPLNRLVSVKRSAKRTNRTTKKVFKSRRRRKSSPLHHLISISSPGRLFLAFLLFLWWCDDLALFVVSFAAFALELHGHDDGEFGAVIEVLLSL